MSINTINCSFDELFLEMRKSFNVILRTLNLNLGLSAYYTETCAWSIEEATVEFLINIGKLTTIIINYYGIIYSKTMQVGIERL